MDSIDNATTWYDLSIFAVFMDISFLAQFNAGYSNSRMFSVRMSVVQFTTPPKGTFSKKFRLLLKKSYMKL